MSRLLLIEGVFTSGRQNYANLIEYLTKCNYLVEVFKHNDTDDAADIVNQLRAWFKESQYDVVIAHSMGCHMMTYLLNDPKFVKTYHAKTIFSHPWIPESMCSLKMMNLIPWKRYLYVPYFERSLHFYSLYSILSFTFDYPLGGDSIDVWTRNHVKVIATPDDQWVDTGPEFFDRLTEKGIDFYQITGKHEPFDQKGDIATMYFAALSTYLM